jgi:hypothetical protein
MKLGITMPVVQSTFMLLTPMVLCPFIESVTSQNIACRRKSPSLQTNGLLQNLSLTIPLH